MKKFISLFEKNFTIFITYSFIGWIYELLYFLIVDSKLINRGFLFGPYLPVYGFGALILYYLLRNFMKKEHKVFNININVILVFIIIFIVTTIVEYVSHFILDTYFDIILWDYSDDFLNINGRVCLAASRNFAIGGTFLIYLVQPLVDKINTKYSNNNKYHIIILSLLIIILSDLLVKIITLIM